MSIQRTLSVFYFVFVATQLTACSGGRVHSAVVESSEYEIRVTDKSADLAFELVLESRSSRDICIDVADWIGDDSLLTHGSRDAVLRAEGVRRVGIDRNGGFCLGGCGVIRVRPRESLAGSLSYAAFGDASEVLGLGKKDVQFSPRVRYCSADESPPEIRDEDVLREAKPNH
jgi:hypothetical protein